MIIQKARSTLRRGGFFNVKALALVTVWLWFALMKIPDLGLS